jgi:tetratricopeptide (TPR) repeat protein
VRQENRSAALETLDRVGAMAPRELKLKARLLQIRCCEEEGRWERAIPLWQDLLKDPQPVPGGKARILYALGLCYRNADPPREEEAIKAWQEALLLGGEEGQAAGLRLGELRLLGAKSEPAKALADLARALEKVRAPGDYRNTLLDLPRVQETFETICRHFREAKDFARLQQAADLYKRIALPGVAEERVAQALEGQARELPLKSTSSQAGASELQEEARTAYLRAAALYEQAAAARPQGRRSEPLWRSAMCYLPAREHSKITSVLERFVSEEKTELRLAEAYLIMADAYTALGNKAMALEAYRKCIEIPATPFAYRARYQWALEEIERKNLSQAEEILKDNLTASGPALDREAHEKSLYKLAALVYQRQDYDKASFHMKQAVHFYPHNPNQLLLRDQLGDCYRMLAKPWTKKWQDNLKEAGYKRERDRLLELALHNYQGLVDACLRLWQCYGVIFDPQENRRLQDVLRTLVQETLADVQAMDPGDEAFQANPEWPRERWLARLREVYNQLNITPTTAAPTVPR